MASNPVSLLPSAMMTRWRRRRLCMLERTGFSATPAAIRAVDGTGARIESVVALTPGEEVAIRHSEAGHISGRVVSTLDGEVRVAFARDVAAVAFALGVIAADMSNPG